MSGSLASINQTQPAAPTHHPVLPRAKPVGSRAFSGPRLWAWTSVLSQTPLHLPPHLSKHPQACWSHALNLCDFCYPVAVAVWGQTSARRSGGKGPTPWPSGWLPLELCCEEAWVRAEGCQRPRKTAWRPRRRLGPGLALGAEEARSQDNVEGERSGRTTGGARGREQVPGLQGSGT